MTKSLIRLNLGCGPIQPDGWVNIDGSNRAWLASRLPWLDKFLVLCRLIPVTEFNSSTRVVNVLKGLPYDNDSVAAIYGGEVLEHFTLDQATQLLKECLRVLEPGGILRLRVPDNYRFWKNYVTEFEHIRTLPREEWTDAHTRWTKMFFRDICVRRPGFGSMGHFHKWMYDEVSLVLAFEREGFVEVERRTLHSSRINSVELVESHEDLTIEGIKPLLKAQRPASLQSALGIVDTIPEASEPVAGYRS